MIIFQQKKTNRAASAGSSQTLQWTNNTIAGGLIVAGANNSASGAGLLSSITDTAGNIYVKIDELSGGDGSTSVWYAKNTNPGTTPTVTFNVGGALTANPINVWMREYSGASLTNPFDQLAHTINNSFNTPNMSTTTGAIDTYSELVVAIASVTITSGQTFTLTGGLTNEDKQTASAPEISVSDMVVNGFGPVTVTVTNSANTSWTMTAATFRAASATKTVNLRPHAFSPGLAR